MIHSVLFLPETWTRNKPTGYWGRPPLRAAAVDVLSSNQTVDGMLCTGIYCSERRPAKCDPYMTLANSAIVVCFFTGIWAYDGLCLLLHVARLCASIINA
jgi:hypothetical protein